MSAEAKNLDYYLALPYRVERVRNEDGTWFARLPELPGCMTWTDTREELDAMVEDAKAGWIGDALESGDPVPEPGSQGTPGTPG